MNISTPRGVDKVRFHFGADYHGHDVYVVMIIIADDNVDVKTFPCMKVKENIQSCAVACTKGRIINKTI